MAKQRINHNEFPHNKGIRARLEAVIAGYMACRGALENVERFALPQLPEKTRSVLTEQIADAMAKAELALQAISGDEQ